MIQLKESIRYDNGSFWLLGALNDQGIKTYDDYRAVCRIPTIEHISRVLGEELELSVDYYVFVEMEDDIWYDQVNNKLIRDEEEIVSDWEFRKLFPEAIAPVAITPSAAAATGYGDYWDEYDESQGNSYQTKEASLNRRILGIPSNDNELKFIFSQEVWSKIQILVHTARKEVGWVGTVLEMKDKNTFLIDEIWVPEQHVHGTETDIAEKFWAKFQDDLMQVEGGMDKLLRLRYWGHSHVNMDVTPSFTDDEQIIRMSTAVPWFLMSIHNKQGEVFCGRYQDSTGVLTSDIPYEYGTDPQLQKWVDEVMKNVKEVSPVKVNYDPQNVGKKGKMKGKGKRQKAWSY